MMKKWLIPILALSMVLTGCSQANSVEEKAATQEPLVKEYAVTVTKAMPAAFSESTQLSGQLAPYDEVYISAKAAGEITVIHKKLGDFVTSGESLMQLDETAYRLGKSKASLGVENANATYNNVRDAYNRSKQLYDSGALSQAEMDAAKLQLDMAELGLKNAKLDLESALLNLEYMQISAPISGVIAEQNGSVGENVGPGQSLYRIVDISSFYVELGVSESLITKLSVGQKVDCTAQDGIVIEGLIEHVSPVMNGNTKAYPVKIKLDNKEQALRSGMSVTASIQIKASYDALAVPKEAVMIIGDKRYVMLVKEGIVEQREIGVGAVNEERFEILSGLNEGDVVVISGPSLLKPGDKVKIQE